MLVESAAVFLATVDDMDEHAYDADEKQPKTKITFKIDEVLYGTYDEPSMDVTIRGGFYPSGPYLDISGVPKFSMGHQYLLFYHGGEYFIDPFIASQLGVLRKVTSDSRDFFVDREGYLISTSKFHGLQVSHRAAKSMKAAYVQQMWQHASFPEDEFLTQKPAVFEYLDQSTTTDNVLAHVRKRIGKFALQASSSAPLPLHTTPQPIPEDQMKPEEQKDGGQ